MALSLPGGWREGNHASLTIYIKDIRDPHDKRRRLAVKPWSCVKDIKNQLHPILGVPSSRQRLFHNSKEMKNFRTLQECGIFRDGAMIWFCIAHSEIGTRPLLQPYGHLEYPRKLLKILHQVQQGLAIGYTPTLAMDGTGGTYFFRNVKQRVVGCFKPQDEEPFAPNNPRGFIGELGQSGFRQGILSGEACEREVAAYLLDKDHFSSIPVTAFAEALHPVFNYMNKEIEFKVGSFQEFVYHDDVASDLSPTLFAVDQVHKIALLDMRLLNTDRHDANILVQRKRHREDGEIKNSYELIPIDHGYCLPDRIEIAWCDWCWYTWPQIKEPMSTMTREYILNLNLGQDASILSNQLAVRPECIRHMVSVGMLLKKGAFAGLTLYDVARIICREELDSPSRFERIMEHASFLTEIKYKTSPMKTNGNSFLNGVEGLSSVSGITEPVYTTPIKDKIDYKSIRIDVNAPSVVAQNSSEGTVSSPPGFWASFAPFSARSVDSSCNFPSWDSIASNALDQAVVGIEENNQGDDLMSLSELESYKLVYSLEKEITQLYHMTDVKKCYFLVLDQLLDKEVCICR